MCDSGFELASGDPGFVEGDGGGMGDGWGVVNVWGSVFGSTSGDTDLVKKAFCVLVRCRMKKTECESCLAGMQSAALGVATGTKAQRAS